MEYMLDPAVIDDARHKGGFSSDDKLTVATNIAVGTLRNLRKGKFSPSFTTLMKLRDYSGWDLNDMIIEKPTTKKGKGKGKERWQ